MRKFIYYILSLSLIFSAGCTDNVSEESTPKMATIKLRQNGFEAAVIDEDNLESEQTIKTLLYY